MKASKETASVAYEHFWAIVNSLRSRMTEEEFDERSGEVFNVSEFLQAARRKLPSEAAYKRDRSRSR